MSKVGTKNGSAKSVGVTAGSRKTNAVSVGGASRIGNQTLFTKAPKGDVAKPAATPLGNELAKNVGAGGPGKGRTVHGSGSQGQH